MSEKCQWRCDHCDKLLDDPTRCCTPHAVAQDAALTERDPVGYYLEFGNGTYHVVPAWMMTVEPELIKRRGKPVYLAAPSQSAAQDACEGYAGAHRLCHTWVGGKCKYCGAKYEAAPSTVAQGATPDSYPARLLAESDASLAWRVDAWHKRNPLGAAQGATLTDDDGKFIADYTLARMNKAGCPGEWGDYAYERIIAATEIRRRAQLAAAPTPVADSGAMLTDERIREITMEVHDAKFSDVGFIDFPVGWPETFARAILAAAKPVSVDAPVSEAGIVACSIAIKAVCTLYPKEQWTKKIQARIRYMLNRKP